MGVWEARLPSAVALLQLLQVQSLQAQSRRVADVGDPRAGAGEAADAGPPADAVAGGAAADGVAPGGEAAEGPCMPDARHCELEKQCTPARILSKRR